MKSKRKKKTRKRNKKRHERQKVVTGTPVQPASDLFDQHIARQTARIALECKNNELACRRKKCFPNERFDEMTFANSIDTDSTAYASAKKYADEFHMFLDKHVGLLFFGSFGTGKTYLAACICNALIDKGYTCKLMTLEETIHELMAAENKARYLDKLTAVDMLVLDDFGAEWQSDFMIAKAFEIMNKRYITRKPLIVTTNFTKAEILHPKPQLNRVMSRLWEMCLPINANGADKRRVKVYSRQDEFPEMYPPTQPSNPA